MCAEDRLSPLVHSLWKTGFYVTRIISSILVVPSNTRSQFFCTCPVIYTSGQNRLVTTLVTKHLKNYR